MMSDACLVIILEVFDIIQSFLEAASESRKKNDVWAVVDTRSFLLFACFFSLLPDIIMHGHHRRSLVG
jgi:hypothetical protein